MNEPGKMNYQSNSNKDKEKAQRVRPEKDIRPVVTGKVIVQKRSLGKKFKDTFIEADFGSVMRYVVTDILIPSARNMIVDVTTKGIERMIYGESGMRRGGYRFGNGRSLITYNNPPNRDFVRPGYRSPPLSPQGQLGRPGGSRLSRDDFILSTREEGELVLERMNDIIDTYQVVTVAELNELVGYPTTHTDNKWGWDSLVDAQVRQIREGYILDLPPAEPIN